MAERKITIRRVMVGEREISYQLERKAVKNLNLRVRVLSGSRVENRLSDTFREHVEIIDACLREDWEGAAQAMTKHLENARLAAFPLLIGDEVEL